MKPGAPNPSVPTPGRFPEAAGGAQAQPASSAPSRLQRLLPYRRLFLLALAVFIADQLTKNWIVSHLPYGAYAERGGIAVVPGFFYLVHVGNTGGAWSLLSGNSRLLALIGLSVLLAVFFWRRMLGLRLPFPQFCFGLFVGGSIGNIFDRLYHGHVTDFLDFHFGDYVYPTFNLADSAICVGVGCYVLWSLRQPPPLEDKN